MLKPQKNSKCHNVLLTLLIINVIFPKMHMYMVLNGQHLLVMDYIYIFPPLLMWETFTIFPFFSSGVE